MAKKRIRTEHRSEWEKAWRASYFEKHPEKKLMWRINSCIAFLTKNGYTVQKGGKDNGNEAE